MRTSRGTGLAALLTVAVPWTCAAAPEVPVVVAGAFAGATWVDLPDANRPGETLGAGSTVRFDLGWAPLPWLELGAACGFAFLGESDSLNAILVAEGRDGVSARTFVQAEANARLRWRAGASRWMPFVRGGFGASGLSESAPGGRGDRALDPAWSAGAGLDLVAHPKLVLRAEAAYIGQAADGGARSHAVAGVALLAGIPRRSLD